MKKGIRKLAFVLCAALMMTSLVACTQPENTSSQPETSSSSSEMSEKTSVNIAALKGPYWNWNGKTDGR